VTITERLNDVLNNTGAPKAVLEDRPWQITEAGEAEWVLRKRAVVVAEIAQVDALVDEQVRVLEEFREREHARLLPSLNNWDTLLAKYHRQKLAEDGEAKTLHFPHGTLTARKLPDNVEIADEVALLDWALEHEPRFVRVKESLDRSAIKDAVLKSGEIVPGVKPTEGEVRFAVDIQDLEAEG
jgi:hypothetical protein